MSPVGHLIEPRDVVEAVLFLASGERRYITRYITGINLLKPKRVNPYLGIGKVSVTLDFYRNRTVEAVSRSRKQSFGIFYGWYVLTAAFIVYTLSHGVQFSFGVFFIPLSEKFDWSRSLTAGAFMIYMTCRGFSSLVMGGLSDRYGPRPIVMIGGGLMGLGMLLGTVISRIGELYFFYGVMAGAGMGVVTAPLSATVSRWFIARRGLAQALLLTGSGLGNLIVSPLAGFLIRSFGLNWAYLLVGSSTLVSVSLLSLLLQKEPSAMGLRPYGGEVESGTGQPALQNGRSQEAVSDWRTPQALRTGSFWLLVSVAFIFGFGLHMMTANIVAYGTDRGISMAVAPYLLSIIGGGNIIGIMGMSHLAERIGNRRALGLCLGVQALAFFWLAGISTLLYLCVAVAIFGFSYGGTILGIMLITPELFGLKSLGSILGMVIFIHLLGGALGSEIGNLIYDFGGSHSYSPGFFLGGCAYTAAVILAMIMKRPRH